MKLARLAFTLPLLMLASTASSQDDDAPAKAPEGRSYVALVVGVSTYESLPDAVQLDFARSDAAKVTQALKKQANFDDVFRLLDGEAKKKPIYDLLGAQIPQLVSSKDIFLLYFVGHGIGSDFDLPVLLAHDSTLSNGQNDGLELNQFVQDLQTWTQAGGMVLVTDAIHRNRHEGINFYGPHAEQWPALPPNTMVISSSQAQQAARDGLFGGIFADAISGRADRNGDRLVTAGELREYLTKALSETGQTPMFGGTYPDNMVIAQDVEETYGLAGGGGNIAYPDYTVEKAKFVWQEGGSHTIKCREKEIITCDPLCYVRNFKAGPCELSAVFDGTPLKGQAIVVGPGKYDCLRKGGELVCTGP